MRRARSPEQWEAMRLLREHETPVTYDLLAQAAGAGLTGDDIATALADAEKGIGHARLLNSQLSAMRQLIEGGAPTLNCVAAVANLNFSHVTHEGIRAGWKKPNIAQWRKRVRAELATDVGAAEAAKLPNLHGATTLDGAVSRPPEIGRAARVSAMLVKHADQLLTQVERQGGVLTKPQLDAMLAMVRLAEKFEPIAAKEAAENQKKSDEEVAELYERIKKKIEARARHYARQMVARGDFGIGAGAQ